MRFIAEVQVKYFLLTWAIFFSTALVRFLASGSAREGVGGFIRSCFPPEIWRQKSPRMDIAYYVIYRVLNRVNFFALGAAATVVASAACNHALHILAPHYAPHAAGFLVLVACAIAVYMVSDLGHYVSHASQHYVPVLWELHKVHHSAAALSPFTEERRHPVEVAYDGTVFGIFTGLAIGVVTFVFNLGFTHVFAGFALVSFAMHFITLDGLQHSHIPVRLGVFERLLISPHMHQLHHSYRIEHWDRNFGNKLSIWDGILGTRVYPRKQEAMASGLGTPEEAEYNRFYGIYFEPFVKIWRLVRTPREDLPFVERVLWSRARRRSPMAAE